MIYNEFENNQADVKEKKINQLISTSEVLSQKIIPLLQERLIVNFTQRKTGEVVVRKVVETNIVNINIPVRSEKLIIDQVTPNYKQLAIIELAKPPFLNEKEFYQNYPEILNLIDSEQSNSTVTDTSQSQTVIKEEINSIEDAHKFLDSIFTQMSDSCKISQIEVTLRAPTSEVK